MKVGLMGLGSWGTVVGILLARDGHRVAGWTRRPEHRDALRREKENRKYLPGNEFPDLLQIVDRPDQAVDESEIVVFAVPSQAVRETALAVRDHLGPVPVVNLAKGLERDSIKRMLEVLGETLAPGTKTASLVGPSHAEEVIRDHPTAVVATSEDASVAETVQRVFSIDNFRVYTNRDTVGVELAVALKNVIAVAAGVSRGLGYGDNTLGTLITRGLAEMTRLGCAAGAEPETFFGLAGVGDLVTTCGSPHSRNRRLGEAVGRGVPLEEALRGLGMVAEGVATTAAARELARRTGTEMPIVEQMYGVLFEKKPPQRALRDLMAREPRAEA